MWLRQSGGPVVNAKRQAGSDTMALEDLLLRLSALVEDLPQLAEIDFNPVKVLPQGEGYRIVDARVMVK